MFKFAVASLLAVASLVVAQNDPSINSPASVVQCQPVQLSWTATKEPVYISIIPGGQPGAVPIEDFGVQKAGTKSMTWTCDMKAGSSITFQIKDAAGAVAYSGNVNVQDSNDSSCVRTDLPPAPSSTAASATPSSGGASSAPAPWNYYRSCSPCKHDTCCRLECIFPCSRGCHQRDPHQHRRCR
ncbi:hypothetical protein B0J17DRAFT_264740 [Rhizoctonia solani]|nr:hypothetical protein B0J17DRAFT_264740 [Rhizoctonia solani]